MDRLRRLGERAQSVRSGNPVDREDGELALRCPNRMLGTESEAAIYSQPRLVRFEQKLERPDRRAMRVQIKDFRVQTDPPHMNPA